MNTNPPTTRRVAFVAAATVVALLVAVVCGLVIVRPQFPRGE